MAGAIRTTLSPGYRISIAAIVVCGIIGAVLAYRDGRRSELEETEAEFARRAAVQHALTGEVLNRYKESLFGLSAIFSLDSTITPAEFSRATAHLQKRLSGALAFEWVPAVPRENRAAVEAALQRVYPRRGFEFLEFDAAGHARRAEDRPLHYPICYVEPLQGNEIALGYDLASGPSVPFLEKARAERRMVVTSQFRLVQEKTNQLGVVMIWPVFRPASPNRPMGSSDDVFTGFLQCVFHVHDLLETASASQTNSILDRLYIDAQETDPAKRIMYYRAANVTSLNASMPTEAEFRAAAPFTREMDILIGERTWKIVYRPRTEWLATRHSLGPIFRGATLLVLSSLVAGLVLVVGRRTATIQREVEQRTHELAESRRQYANLLHTLPGLAYRGTYDDTFEVRFASDGALKLTGWSAADFASGAVHVRDLLHPEDVERVRRETKAALEAHKNFEVEYRIRTRSGDEKWVLSRGRGVYDAAGKLEAMEGLLIDITDAKRAEESRLSLERKLLETQKLESLGLLAGGVAHDFNNLLSAILGNASLARMSLDPNHEADAQLRAIESAGLRAAELCRQMLAYAGKGQFVVERVDLSALVDDLLPLLRVSIARSAELQLDLLPRLPGVKADATQLRQIVMNLVINAVDAVSGRHGRITISTGVARVDRELLARCVTGNELPLGDYVFLEVGDTGCGMAPEVASKIFDPFFTTKFSGRGLGLAAVLGIVRSHNGALLVESEINHGSKFRLFLPIIPGDVPRPSPAESVTSEPWRMNGDALVIEDEEPVRVVMVELLKTFGFDAYAAENGSTGISMFRESANRWSLVIIDLLMPGMSGEETLAALRAIRADIPVLLVSGYAEGDIVKRVRGPGRVVFLPKPFRRDVFEKKLKELLG